MIATRGLGRSSIKTAIVAAGLCVGILTPHRLPNANYIVLVQSEVRMVIQEETVEDRTVEVAAENRSVTVAAESRVVTIAAENRIVEVEA